MAHRKSTAHHFLLLTVVMAGLLVACARMATPDGGPYDETPPRMVGSTPRLGATGEEKIKKVVIEFDEIVRIDNAMEKVVISPPQIQLPEIEAAGRQVTVTLLDTLKPSTTYSIDFSDAIVDNNEGNPYGDFAFTFSTGERLDTFQMSGSVLQADNLEPIKGILVGLYCIEKFENGQTDIAKEGDKDGNTAPAEQDSTLAENGSAAVEKESTALGNGSAAAASSLNEWPDSVFRTRPFDHLSRTDANGHFVVKGLAPGRYVAYALKDLNQNYIYDQRAEMVAFSDRILETYCLPDIRQDTVWHDSIHYDSIVRTPYTHFYPDDIVLLAFEPAQKDRFLLKSERPTPQLFSIFFTAGSDTLPRLSGLNFNTDNAFVIDASQHNDTLNYWVRDSLVYNLDTLEVQVDYIGTDTAGLFVPMTDTLYLTPKLTREKIAKQAAQRQEEWEKEQRQKLRRARRSRSRNRDDEATDSLAEIPDTIPPMPEDFLTFRTSSTQGMAPDRNIDFTFEEPLDSFDLSKIHFSVKVDTLFQPADFIFRKVKGREMVYRLYAEWDPDTTYQLVADTGAFVNIYGKRNEAIKRVVSMKSLDTFSTLFVNLHGEDSTAVVQLLDGDKPVKTLAAKNGRADFYFINPGTYYMRMFRDLNGNGVWDTGDYDKHLLPEPVFYYPDALTLKAQWEITQDWRPAERPITTQKPEKITKQKEQKKTQRRSKNAERERERNHK